MVSISRAVSQNLPGGETAARSGEARRCESGAGRLPAWGGGAGGANDGEGGLFLFNKGGGGLLENMQKK